MKRLWRLLRVVVICSCSFICLQGAEYDWEVVHSDGVGPGALPFGIADFAFGGGVYVAVGDTNFASLNGRDWTPVASFRPNLWGVTYGNGKFVAVGGNWVTHFEDQFVPDIIVISTNGFDWEVVVRRDFKTVPDDNGYTGFQLNDVVFAQGKFFVVGSGSGKMILTSEDAINWTGVTTDVLRKCEHIAYGQGRFVCVGNGVMTSTNGVDWIRTPGSDQNGLFSLYSVGYGGGLYVIGGENGIWESVDGLNWFRKLSVGVGYITGGIAYGAGHRIAVGSSALYARDVYGRWLPVAGMPPLETWGIHYVNGVFWAFGRGNGIMRAPVNSPSTLVALPPGASEGFSFLVQTRYYCDYRIDCSEDFSNWNVLTNFTSITNRFTVTDSTAYPRQRRFYRAVAE